ncbi:hypothetical protein Ahu01nite_052490 [Winogradskya humida]|uniref:Uncharacterized protein n=1 Tax=Winogradskya humida TaxID=113566 RepID=A0ABQ3ZVF3_9ACTN|nr:hypothetical protein Ahu01nite_052490 [Actinoplanes humidus]
MPLPGYGRLATRLKRRCACALGGVNGQASLHHIKRGPALRYRSDPLGKGLIHVTFDLASNLTSRIPSHAVVPNPPITAVLPYLQ